MYLIYGDNSLHKLTKHYKHSLSSQRHNYTSRLLQ